MARCDEDAECAPPGTCRNEHAELHGSARKGIGTPEIVW
jgi:hypothetical protein